MAIEIVASSDVPRRYSECKTEEQREEWVQFFAKSLVRKLRSRDREAGPSLRLVRGGREP